MATRTLSLYHPDSPAALIPATVVRTTKSVLVARTADGRTVEISRRNQTNNTFGPGALHAELTSYLAAVAS